MIDIVKLYDPASAAALTPEEILGLQTLTNEQLKELAKAYPRANYSRAYLLIVDQSKPVANPLPTLSTFEGLYNLKVKNGLRKIVAYNFAGNYKPANRVAVTPKKTQVVDLSDTELMTLPGFKAGTGAKAHAEPPKQVKVTKVKSKKLSETPINSTNA